MIIKTRLQSHTLGMYLVILFLGTMLFLGYSVKAVQAKPLKLKYATISSGVGIKAEMVKWFGNELEKRTEGRVKIEYYFGRSLLHLKESIEGVRHGVADMAMYAASWFPAQLPLFNIIHQPAFVPTAEWIENPSNIIKRIWNFWDKYPIMKEEMGKWNQTLWAAQAFYPYEIFSKKPINSIKDLDGVRIRAIGLKAKVMFKPLGAIPVSISPSEVYGALQKGAIDAANVGFDWGQRYGLKEVAKYLTFIRMNAGSGIITVNLDTINKLNPDDRDVFLKLGREYSLKWAQTVYSSQSEMVKDYKKAGMIITNLSRAEREKWGKICETQLIKAWLDAQEKAGVSNVRAMMKKWLVSIGAGEVMP